MKLLDLFCGAGGAATGYHRAGFDVVGVDIRPQPRYPFEFHQADALTFPLTGFDAIHASPPCQAFSSMRSLHSVVHSDLVTPTRERLLGIGRPWVIENVPGAPMRPDVILCGTMFGLGVFRHRWFEMSEPPAALRPPCVHGRIGDGRYFTVVGNGHGGKGHSLSRRIGDFGSRAQWREAMGIGWMTRHELTQAIPPAYTEWIGRQLLQVTHA
jgi:DNA (cytosine-5)-methyltransferase 1